MLLGKFGVHYAIVKTAGAACPTHRCITLPSLIKSSGEVQGIEAAERQLIRQKTATPIVDALQGRIRKKRQLVPTGSANRKALDYSLKRWPALIRYLDDGEVPIDNNWCENQIRPWRWVARTGSSPSRYATVRSAALMNLVQSVMCATCVPMSAITSMCWVYRRCFFGLYLEADDTQHELDPL